MDIIKRYYSVWPIFLICSIVFGIVWVTFKVDPLIILDHEDIKRSETSSLSIDLAWQIEFDEQLSFEDPLISNNRMIVMTIDKIYGFDISTGTEIWNKSYSSLNFHVPIDLQDSFLAYAESISRLVLVNVDRGNIVWQHQFDFIDSSVIKDILIANEMVYIVTQPTHVFAFDLSTGDMIWHVDGHDYDIPSRGARLKFYAGY